MSAGLDTIAFGPVPSRRLGRSLGVNNIPPKHCPYSCVYCQAGRTTRLEVKRRKRYPPGLVVAAVERRVAECRTSGEAIDFISFVPDGEPTLDLHLGQEIRVLKSTGLPVAVFTNGALLWQPAVRQALGRADLVSVKVDAADEATWRRIARPSRSLRLAQIEDGLRRFADEYRGRLVTETMLVEGLNDSPRQVEDVARLVATLRPAIAYLAVPTRPPAVVGVRPPPEHVAVAAFEQLRARLPRVELLLVDEVGRFGRSGDGAQGLLGILAVQPMPESAAKRYLEEAGSEPAAVEALLASKQVVRVRYRGQAFLARAHRPLGQWDLLPGGDC